MSATVVSLALALLGALSAALDFRGTALLLLCASVVTLLVIAAKGGFAPEDEDETYEPRPGDRVLPMYGEETRQGTVSQVYRAGRTWSCFVDWDSSSGVKRYTSVENSSTIRPVRRSRVD